MPAASHRLIITLSNTDTALQRLVGVVRRRGFRIVSLDAAEESAGVLRVRTLVEGVRSAQTLAEHVANIVDVRSVKVEPQPNAAPPSVSGLLDTVDPPRLR